ncbi:MAG TPA: type II toxin-antitoxin system RelE/ParE family toxin [Bacteroidales bacterium]|jgi:phage-related protein|nr:type II toxin-antitoxin system RelE/ParE family toxin [Bacteroidales bacterium]HNY52497.1 type II toxin-antitoxin system RelE/ParE family toxin [Bacteroidales bacterium]HOG56723.1 type II toxin-antitoxin system RelE/ParE family toxin [Bacteroidales bacterium]
MEQQRKIIFFRTYFEDFVNSLSTGVREKIAYVLFTITVSPRIPSKFFEHLTGTDGLYVIRVEYESNIYRIFCCFDHGMLVVLFNGFQKKTRKTPRSEIDKALKIKEEYFKSKRKE